MTEERSRRRKEAVKGPEGHGARRRDEGVMGGKEVKRDGRMRGGGAWRGGGGLRVRCS